MTEVKESKIRYLYCIAGIRVRCDLPFELIVQEESKEFLRKAEEGEDREFDLELVFQICDVLPNLEKTPVWQEKLGFYHDENEMIVFRKDLITEQVYACAVLKKNANRIQFCCLGEKAYVMRDSHHLLTVLNLETFLMNADSLLLHSSFIRYRDEAILFSAPSGMGKSTQADLWEKYEGAEVLNGDRSASRKVDGKWTTYGLPYAGTSCIYRNEHALLKSIIVLKQAKENKIRRLSAAEAFRYLYPEFSIHRWDPIMIDHCVNLITDLLTEIPVYLLECLPDHGAVALVKETLYGKEAL